MDEWKSLITMGVGLLIVCGAITVGMSLQKTSNTAVASIDKQSAISAEMREYREYYAYNDKTIHPQDLVSLIMTTRGTPYVDVNNEHTWNSTTDNYTQTYIMTVVKSDKDYHTTLVKDASGNIVGIKGVIVD